MYLQTPFLLAGMQAGHCIPIVYAETGGRVCPLAAVYRRVYGCRRKLDRSRRVFVDYTCRLRFSGIDDLSSYFQVQNEKEIQITIFPA